jgi:hypothetical protein
MSRGRGERENDEQIAQRFRASQISILTSERIERDTL